MKRTAIAAAVLAAVWSELCAAGPNIAMKRTCQRFGDAWNTHDREALRAVSTPEFARLWMRMPDDLLAKLPSDQSDAQIVGSDKGATRGTVTIVKSGTTVIFFLEAVHGQWRVADVQRAGRDGRPVFLQDYFDALLAARRFKREIRSVPPPTLASVLSPRFLAALQRLAPAELARIRLLFPGDVDSRDPVFRREGADAVFTVKAMVDGLPQRNTFRMVRSDHWMIDDLAVESDVQVIPSVRRALPILTSATAFGQFVRQPRSIDPATFTSDCSLRNELAFIHSSGTFPGTANQKQEALCVSSCCTRIDLTLADGKVQLFACDEDSGRLERVVVHRTGKPRELSEMLAAARNVQQLPVWGTVTNLIGRLAP